jgi:hypothetical protein
LLLIMFKGERQSSPYASHEGVLRERGYSSTYS